MSWRALRHPFPTAFRVDRELFLRRDQLKHLGVLVLAYDLVGYTVAYKNGQLAWQSDAPK